MKLSYDEISPITGNKSVLSEFDHNAGQEMKLCMESGYHTFTSWVEGSDGIQRFEESAPDIVRDTKFNDNGQFWYKIIMMTRDVVLYPDLVDDGIVWKVSTFKFVDDPTSVPASWASIVVGDQVKVLDDSTSSIFNENNFEEACFEFHKRCAEAYNESTDGK